MYVTALNAFLYSILHEAKAEGMIRSPAVGVASVWVYCPAHLSTSSSNIPRRVSGDSWCRHHFRAGTQSLRAANMYCV